MRYRIRPLMFASGERNAVLLGLDGKPMFDPTAFTQSQIRGAGSTVSTLIHHLEAIKILYLFLDASKGLESRLGQRKLFSIGELDSLVSICRSPEKNIPELLKKQDTATGVRVTSLERFRQKTGKPVATVNPAVTASRLYCIRSYVSWFVHRHIGISVTSLAEREQVLRILESFSTQLGERIPSTVSTGNPVLGLARDELETLLKWTKADAADNPWKDKHARSRNELMVRWFRSLGLRRGELLAVQTTDIDFAAGKVAIKRRHGNPKDPRSNQPVVKTLERELPMPVDLLLDTRKYVTDKNLRRGQRGAREHQFLFVSSHTGEPLSKAQLAKIFRQARAAIPRLPPDLSAHKLRHTWNDEYTEKMDRQNTSETDEVRTRSYLMGWKETSGTAARYTRRSVARKANEYLLSDQKQALKKRDDK